MKSRITRLSAALAVVTLGALALPTVASAGPATRSVHAGSTAAADCAAGWTTTAKHGGAMVRSHVSDIRAGRHACFDRLVVDLNGKQKTGFRVRYVNHIIQDGSGKVIQVRGAARLQVTVMAPAAGGFPATSRHLVNVKGFATLRQVVGAGSFEGLTSLGVGVRAKLPFRAFTITTDAHHTRLVIDVAHAGSSHFRFAGKL
jgi:hypothetical protein